MNKNLQTFLLGCIVLFVVVLAGLFIYTKNKPISPDASTDQPVAQIITPTTTTPTTKQESNTQSSQTQADNTSHQQLQQQSKNTIAEIVDSESMLVDEFFVKNSKLTEESKNFIKSLTYYDNLIIPGQGATGTQSRAEIKFVTDGLNPNIVYFIEQNPVDDTSSLLTFTVHQLNMTTNEKAVLYTQKPSIDTYVLDGRIKGNLLLYKSGNGDSPGPCFDGWVYAYENPLPRPKSLIDSTFGGRIDDRTIKSLDINNATSGLVSFDIPKEKYDDSVRNQKSCEDKFKRDNKSGKNFGL